jgi:glutamine cyclotransferase
VRAAARRRHAWRAVVAVTALLGCRANASPPSGPGYRIVDRYPHDTTAYTQGLIYEGGVLYESTGRYGSSELRRVELASGVVEQAVALPAERFGEGIALLGRELFQLTWKAGQAYIYDTAGLRLVDSARYEGEGWGLTTDGSSLILSDGSAWLRFYDPATFKEQRSVEVRSAKREPVTGINELEYADGDLFANVYQSDRLLRIDPASGAVTETIDLAGIMPGFDARSTTEFVLNGIAYDRPNGHLLVTGKRWPLLFRIALDRPIGRQRRGSDGSR